MKKIVTTLLLTLLLVTTFGVNTWHTKYINLATASSPTNLNLASDVTVYYVYGTKTLSSNFTITTTGTPVDGMVITIMYDGSALTTGGNTMTVMGVALSEKEAVQRLIFLCIYKTSSWDTRVFLDKKATNWVGNDDIDTTQITDGSTLTSNHTTGIGVKTGGILNTHIGSGAAIGLSKLAALTASRLPVTDGSGVLTSSAVTATEVGYLSGITSAVQTQLNARPASGAIVNADLSGSAAIGWTKINTTGVITNTDVNASAAIAYSKLALSNSILNADINSAAAIAHSKMAALTASKAAVTDGSGVVTTSATTSTELGYLSGATSNVQSQLNAKSGGGGTYAISSSATVVLDATAKDYYIFDVTSNNISVTLPSAASFTAGKSLTFMKQMSGGTDTVKIAAYSGQSIRSYTTTSSPTYNMVGTAGTSAVFLSNGVDAWMMVKKD